MSGVKQLATSHLSKKMIADSFGQAADTYDAAAPGQKQAIDLLWQTGKPILANLSNKEDQTRLKILEIGCGTGNLAAKLVSKFQKSDLLISDLSPQMLAKAQQKLNSQSDHSNVQFQVLDGEDLTPLAQAQTDYWDLIISSLAFQWFGNPVITLSQWCRALKPGGHILLASMGRDSFQTMRQAQTELGIETRLRDFPALSDYQRMADQASDMANLSGKWLWQEHYFQCDYGSAFDMLKSFQQIGAHGANPAIAPMTSVQLRQLIRHLNQSKRGQQADFHILTACFERDPQI